MNDEQADRLIAEMDRVLATPMGQQYLAAIALRQQQAATLDAQLDNILNEYELYVYNAWGVNRAETAKRIKTLFGVNP